MVSQLGAFQPDPTPASTAVSNLPWFPNEIVSPAVGQLMSISPALVLFSPLLGTSYKHYPSIRAPLTAFHDHAQHPGGIPLSASGTCEISTLDLYLRSS